MKYWMMMLVLLLSLVVVLPSAAQDGGTLSYGDVVTGELNDAMYEVSYTFDGTAGDLVMITFVSDDYGFDGYLYLKDSVGITVTENDDASGLDPRIVLELPSTDTYTILATRLDGADGTGAGPYTLSLGIVEKINPGVPYSAEFDVADAYPVVAFMVPDTGLYEVTYSQNGGESYPNFQIDLLEGEFVTNVLYMSAIKLQGATVVTELDGFMLYIFELTPNYYEWDASGMVSFSVQVTAAQ